MTSCIVYGCTNTSTKKIPGLTFHSFPENEILRNEWMKAVGRENWIPTAASKLCNEHFKTEDFGSISKFRVRLKENAVPTIFKQLPTYLQKKPNKRKLLMPRRVPPSRSKRNVQSFSSNGSSTSETKELSQTYLKELDVSANVASSELCLIDLRDSSIRTDYGVLKVCRGQLQNCLSRGPLQTQDDPTLHKLPPLVIDGIPTPVEKMTQIQLRTFIPLMLKYSTGRGKPGWGRKSTRPAWWPKELPWANVRSDARTEEDKQKVSWNDALRQIVINCYKYHGREDLLPAFTNKDDEKAKAIIQAQQSSIKTITGAQGENPHTIEFPSQRSMPVQLSNEESIEELSHIPCSLQVENALNEETQSILQFNKELQIKVKELQKKVEELERSKKSKRKI